MSNQVWLRIPIAEKQSISLDVDNVKKFSIDAQEIGVKSFYIFTPNRIPFMFIDHPFIACSSKYSNRY